MDHNSKFGFDRFESFLPSPRNQQKNSCRRSQLLSFPSYPPFLSLQGLLDHFLLVVPPGSKSILVGFASKTWSLMPGEIFDTWSLFEVPWFISCSYPSHPWFLALLVSNLIFFRLHLWFPCCFYLLDLFKL